MSDDKAGKKTAAQAERTREAVRNLMAHLAPAQLETAFTAAPALTREATRVVVPCRRCNATAAAVSGWLTLENAPGGGAVATMVVPYRAIPGGATETVENYGIDCARGGR